MDQEARDDFDLAIGLVGDTIMPTDDQYIPDELRGLKAPAWWDEGKSTDVSQMGAILGG